MSVIITRIELQNPRKKTYALYQDDIFLTEISEDTLVHFAISKGKQYTDLQFEGILEFEKVNGCLNQAYNYLQMRPHLKQELIRKLKTKNFLPDTVDKAIQHLEKKKYLDDEACIKLYIKDAFREGKSGPLLIKKKLMEKGAPIPHVDFQLDHLYPRDKQMAIAAEILKKKDAKLPAMPPLKRKQKLLQFGTNRGFSWEVLEPAINRIISD